jgi:hypothetical protein
MKFVASIVVLLFASVLAYAQGPKSCEDLKAEIAKKVEANGAKTYTLDIVAKDKEAEGKEVGHCGGGTMKIMYIRTSPPPAAAESKPAAKPAKPAPATPKP